MDTTLEEVFLKVSEEDQSLENSEAGESPGCHWLAYPTHPGAGISSSQSQSSPGWLWWSVVLDTCAVWDLDLGRR